MPLSHPIRSARDLTQAIHTEDLIRRVTLDLESDIYSNDALEFAPNILDSWARGHYIEVAPKLVRPSVHAMDDNNFYMMREALRREIAEIRQCPMVHHSAVLPDASGWKYPTLVREGHSIRMSFFVSREDCRNDHPTMTTVARYLISEGWGEDTARDKAENLAALFDVPVVEFITDPDAIATMFQAVHKGLGSCMTKPPEAYGLPKHLHPTSAYGLPGDLVMAVLWNNERREKVTARCLAWPEKKVFGRCYGLAAKMGKALIDQGWSFGNFYGAKIAAPIINYEALDKRKGRITHLIPYVDSVDKTSERYETHIGSADYVHGDRGVFTHNGSAYIELVIRESNTNSYSCGFKLERRTTNHHSSGQTQEVVYYYPGKDKMYVGCRTRFALLRGRAKPRRYDIAELHELGYDQDGFVEKGDVFYDKAMMYQGESGYHFTPAEVLDIQQSTPLIVFPGNLLVPRSDCRMAIDTGQYGRLEDLHYDALQREYRQERLRYVATIRGGNLENELLATASSMQHIFDLLRDKPNATVTFDQTDFDNGEVQLRVVDSGSSNQPVRQVGGSAS